MKKKNYFIRIMLIFFSVVLFSLLTYSQSTNRINGRVVDEANEPIVGATVVIKGTQQGIISDAEGKFVLPSVPDNILLQISFVGYQTKEVKPTKNMVVV